MKAEFDTKYQDYTANAAGYSDLVKKTKEEELTQLNQRIEDFRTQAQQDYQKKLLVQLQYLLYYLADYMYLKSIGQPPIFVNTVPAKNII